MSRAINVWTDGACEPNPGVGGWGYVIQVGADAAECFGGEQQTTNNRLELTAVLMALSALDCDAQAMLYSDSTYVVNGLTTWRTRWRKRGWCKKTGEPMPNRDLWLLLEAQLQRVPGARLCWVRGHNGDPGNERADALAACGRAGAVACMETSHGERP